MNLVFSHLVTENRDAFLNRVVDISRQLGIDPNWLMAVMWKESRINHRAVNRQPGDSADPFVRAERRATGLIQFMPNTSRGLGTTNQALFRMSNVQQLDFVLAYYRPFRGRIRSYIDLYKATFFPISMGRPDNWVFQSQGLSAQLIAQQNPTIFRNENGVITVATFTRWALSNFPADVLEIITQNTQSTMNLTAKNIKIICTALILVASILTMYQLLKK